MTAKMRLLLATTNQGKVVEYREMLKSQPIQVVSLHEAGIRMDVKETGATIHDNAVLKARTYAAVAKMPAIADDSGLEVDALAGEPGVRSARYAGAGASDVERNDLLLRELKDVPDALRTAHFRCVIALATPFGVVRTSEGICEGRVARQPRGTLGFGYDPIFFLPTVGKHMAELALDEKNAISHRGQAMLGVKQIIEELTPNDLMEESESGVPYRFDQSLTHLDSDGQARMVDVSSKNDTPRKAVAKGRVTMRPETIALVKSGHATKGDVIAVAKVAGIMAAKRTSELIPLCHPLMLTKIDVELELNEGASTVDITATVKTTGKTGVEMEALTAVSVSALTVYDMCKAVDRGMHIEGVRLVRKMGGKSGDIILE